MGFRVLESGMDQCTIGRNKPTPLPGLNRACHKAERKQYYQASISRAQRGTPRELDVPSQRKVRRCKVCLYWFAIKIQIALLRIADAKDTAQGDVPIVKE